MTEDDDATTSASRSASRSRTSFVLGGDGHGTLRLIGWHDFAPINQFTSFTLPTDRLASLTAALDEVNWEQPLPPQPGRSADEATVLSSRNRTRLRLARAVAPRGLRVGGRAARDGPARAGARRAAVCDPLGRQAPRAADVTSRGERQVLRSARDLIRLVSSGRSVTLLPHRHAMSAVETRLLVDGPLQRAIFTAARAAKRRSAVSSENAALPLKRSITVLM